MLGEVDLLLWCYTAMSIWDILEYTKHAFVTVCFRCGLSYDLDIGLRGLGHRNLVEGRGSTLEMCCSGMRESDRVPFPQKEVHLQLYPSDLFPIPRGWE